METRFSKTIILLDHLMLHLPDRLDLDNGMEAGFSRKIILLLTISCFIYPHHLSSATFKVNGPAQSILAFEGKDILLSCYLSPKMDAQNMTIKWFHGQTLIHRYHFGQKVEETRGPEFEGRTELMKHDLAEGKATLKISKVQLSDSGNCTCHFRSLDYYHEAHFVLQVSETAPPSQETMGLSLKIFLCTAVWLVVPFVLVFTTSVIIDYKGRKKNNKELFHCSQLEEDREKQPCSVWTHLTLPESSIFPANHQLGNLSVPYKKEKVQPE